MCSIDFIMNTPSDSIDFIISISEAINKMNKFDHRKRLSKIKSRQKSSSEPSNLLQKALSLTLTSKLNDDMIKQENEILKDRVQQTKIY